MASLPRAWNRWKSLAEKVIDPSPLINFCLQMSIGSATYRQLRYKRPRILFSPTRSLQSVLIPHLGSHEPGTGHYPSRYKSARSTETCSEYLQGDCFSANIYPLQAALTVKFHNEKRCCTERLHCVTIVAERLLLRFGLVGECRH